MGNEITKEMVVTLERNFNAIFEDVLSEKISVEVVLATLDQLQKGENFSFDFDRAKTNFLRPVEKIICPPTQAEFIENTRKTRKKLPEMKKVFYNGIFSSFGKNPKRTDQTEIGFYEKAYQMDFIDFLSLAPRSLEEQVLTRNQIIEVMKTDSFKMHLGIDSLVYFLSKNDESDSANKENLLILVFHRHRYDWEIRLFHDEKDEISFDKGDRLKRHLEKVFVVPFFS